MSHASNDSLSGEARGVAREGILLVVGGGIGKFAEFLYKREVSVGYGPEAWGLFSLGLMTLVVGAAVMQVGLDQGLSHFLARWRDDRRRSLAVARVAFRIVFLVSIFGAASIVLAAPALADALEAPGLERYLHRFALFLPVAACGELTLAALYGLGWGRYKVLFQDLLVGGGLLGAAWWMVRRGAPLPDLVFAQGALLLAMLATTSIVLRRRMGGNPWWGETVGTGAELGGFSWPIALRPLLEVLPVAVLLFFVGAHRGAADAGIFAVAILLASPFRFVQLPFVVLYMPLATRFADAGPGRLERLHRTAARWSSLVVVPGAAFVALHAEAILVGVFGEAYAAATVPLRVLLAGIGLGALAGPTHTLLLALRRPRLHVANRVPFAVAVLAAAIWFTPSWGIAGAAGGILLGDIALKGVSAWQVGRIRRFVPLDIRVVAALAIYILAGAGLRILAARWGWLEGPGGWVSVVALWAVGFGCVLATTGGIGDLRRLRGDGDPDS